MKWMESLKQRAKKLKKELLSLHFAYQDPQVGWLPKFLILFTLSYALSPIDLIPDFIPLLGYLDDLLILPVLITLSIKLIPDKILEKARQKAEKESLKLKKRWVFAILFVMIWLTALCSFLSWLT